MKRGKIKANEHGCFVDRDGVERSCNVVRRMAGRGRLLLIEYINNGKVVRGYISVGEFRAAPEGYGTTKAKE